MTALAILAWWLALSLPVAVAFGRVAHEPDAKNPEPLKCEEKFP